MVLSPNFGRNSSTRFFGSRFAGAGLLADDIVVVDGGGLVVLLLVVKLGDLEGIAGLRVLI